MVPAPFSFMALFSPKLRIVLWLCCSALFLQAAAQVPETEVAAHVEHLAREGQISQAEAVARNSLATHPQSVPLNVVMGELASYKKQWTQAMSFFETALHADASDEHARKGERDAAVALALDQRNSGDAETALTTLQHASAALPADAEVMIDLAIQAQAMHRLKLAMDAANAALAIAPNSGRALYTAAGIHFDRGESSAAAAQYRAFLQQHPQDASAHFGLGRSLRIQQQSDEAERELRRSIELQPVQTEAYYQLGEIALEAGRDDEARADYAKTLERMPTHGGALTGMGELLYRAHSYAEARTYLDRALANSPDYQPAHYYLGLTLRRLGDASAAERELKLATDLAAKQQGKGAPVAAQ